MFVCQFVCLLMVGCVYVFPRCEHGTVQLYFGYCDYGYHKQPHKFSVSIRREGKDIQRSSVANAGSMDGFEDRVAPFADDSVISILRKHRVQLIFGGESYLPDDFCGLGWVDSLRSEHPHSDLFLQLHLDGSLSASYSRQEISDGIPRSSAVE